MGRLTANIDEDAMFLLCLQLNLQPFEPQHKMYGDNYQFLLVLHRKSIFYNAQYPYIAHLIFYLITISPRI